ncbi:hypothetical protein EVG20_g2062 [Dentipellis fragilis]|uniref:G-patch domain-containing protein n=1 Tax=Dentipellis fragilis TaxID=205917 RepID=A0A4Y9ZC17_9AGAM|nr:hypothetical protein EVG20_g2062 [Dentipellis fragilis]
MTTYGLGSCSSPIVIDDSDDETADDFLVAQELRPENPGQPTPSPPRTLSDQEASDCVTESSTSRVSRKDQTCKGIKAGKGYQLLVRMGFQPGYGLGPRLEGPTNPLELHLRHSKPLAGIGAPISGGKKRAWKHILEDRLYCEEPEPQASTSSSSRASHSTSLDSSAPPSTDISSTRNRPPQLQPQMPPLSSLPPLPPLLSPPTFPPLVPLSSFPSEPQGPFGYGGGYNGYSFGGGPPFTSNAFNNLVPCTVMDQSSLAFGYSFPSVQSYPLSTFQDTPSNSKLPDLSTSAVDLTPMAEATGTTMESGAVGDTPSSHKLSSTLAQKKQRPIGMDHDAKASIPHGTFTKVTLSPLPAPAKTLVMEAIPRKFRNVNFVIGWLSQFKIKSMPRFEIDQGKALIEFASRHAAEQAFSSPRMGGGEGLSGIRVFWYRLPPPEQQPAGLVKEETDTDASATRSGTIAVKETEKGKKKAASLTIVDTVHTPFTIPQSIKVEPSLPAPLVSPPTSSSPSHTLSDDLAYIPRSAATNDSTETFEAKAEDISPESMPQAATSETLDFKAVEKQQLLARHRALEEKIALAKAEMTQMMSTPTHPPEPSLTIELTQQFREESLRRMVLLSKRKRAESCVDTRDVSSNPTAILEPEEQKTPVASTSTSHAASGTSSPESSSESRSEISPTTSRSSALDELAISFISNTIQSCQPPPAKRFKSEKDELAKRQKELESHIVETKSLMQLLSTTRSKEDKGKIMAKLRVLNRRMEEIFKANSAAAASAAIRLSRSPPPSSFAGNKSRWPETSFETGILIISDSEDDDSDMDDGE